MIRGILLGVGLGALLCAAPAVANAAEPVLVAPALTHGNLSDAVRDQLEIRLHEVVRKSDLEVLEVADELGQRAAGCDANSCRADVIAASRARFLLVPEITLDDKDYHLRLTLYARSGAKTAQLEETCSLCGLAEAVDLLGDLGARMGRKVDVATRAAFVEVRTRPPGANVFVAGELVGTTPLELPLDAGAHRLRIELDGYIGLQRRVDVVAGELTTLDLGLQRAPAGMSRLELLRGLGWTGLVVGTGAAAAGVTLMVLDERPITSDCSGANVDVQGNCRWRHATLESGIGLAAGGAVLLGVGIALLVVGRHKSKSSRSSAAVRMKPTWAGLAFEF